MDWVQWLALTGGLVAALAFVAGRLDLARSDAAAVYVIATRVKLSTAEMYEAKFEVHNDGPLPILNVHATLFEGTPNRRITWRIRQSWMDREGHPVPTPFSVIGPKSSTEQHDLLRGLEVDPSEFGDPLQVMLVFVDGHGRDWVRWPDGRLSRLRPWRNLLRLVRWWRGRTADRSADGSASGQANGSRRRSRR